MLEYKKIDALDGLRGLAAFYMYIFHQLYNVKFETEILVKLVRHGYISILLFFVVSGFLLFTSIERNAVNNKNWRLQFYIRRAARILPLWWLLLLAQLLVFGMPSRVFWANFTFVFGFLMYDSVYLPIIQAWTLFSEECFYALLPWLKNKINSIHSAIVWLMFSVILARFWVEYAPKAGVPTANDFVHRFPLNWFSCFFLGIFLSYAYKNSSIRNWVAQIFIHPRSLIVDFGILVIFFSPILDLYFPPEAACALLIISALSGHSILSRVFSWGPLCWVGRRCYFIYITQSFVDLCFVDLKYMFGNYLHLSDDATRIAWLPIALPIIFVLAEISWRFWEQPWQRLAKKWIAKQQPALL